MAMTNLATIVRHAGADHSGRPAVRQGDHVLTKSPTGKILRREVQPPAGENS
jgi:hypothetical protein